VALSQTDSPTLIFVRVIANSPLVGQIEFKQGTTWRMTTSKQPDFLNRLKSTATTPSASAPVSFTYLYNNSNQRTRTTLADNSYWVHGYDVLGQVNASKKYFIDGTLVPGQQFEFTFDDIGNRKTAKAGGDSAGANLRSATYTPNLLNQYNSRTVPGGLDVLGIADDGATLTITSPNNGVYRKGQ